MRFLPRLKQATDAVHEHHNRRLTHMTVQERLAAPLLAKPEMCSLNMGSMNFGIFPLADRYTNWKHDWEEPYRRALKTSSSATPSEISRTSWNT